MEQYGNRGLPVGPAVILVHMVSVWVPFTSESKEAIANYPEIIDEIKLAVQECGRQLGRFVAGKRRAQEREMKRRTIERYAPEVAKALNVLTGEETEKILESIYKIANKKFIKVENERTE